MLAVIEIQKDGDTASSITQLLTDTAQAKSKYHEILAIAAVSSVPEHSVILISEEGHFMVHEKYTHETEEVEE
jgi:hypothetical protein